MMQNNAARAIYFVTDEQEFVKLRPLRQGRETRFRRHRKNQTDPATVEIRMKLKHSKRSAAKA